MPKQDSTYDSVNNEMPLMARYTLECIYMILRSSKLSNMEMSLILNTETGRDVIL